MCDYKFNTTHSEFNTTPPPDLVGGVEAPGGVDLVGVEVNAQPPRTGHHGQWRPGVEGRKQAQEPPRVLLQAVVYLHIVAIAGSIQLKVTEPQDDLQGRGEGARGQKVWGQDHPQEGKGREFRSGGWRSGVSGGDLRLASRGKGQRSDYLAVVPGVHQPSAVAAGGIEVGVVWGVEGAVEVPQGLSTRGRLAVHLIAQVLKHST